MTNQEIYELLMDVDQGRALTEQEMCQLALIKNIRWRGIEQLPKSMVFLSSLEKLDLHNTGVTDVSALTGLSKIISLDLHNTKVNNVNTLSGLIGLINLDLSLNMNLEDISKLSGLKNLKKLDLHYTNVSNITGLKELDNLSDLNLRGTRINECGELSGLTSLLNLNLSCTNVSDISALKNLLRLENLDISQTNISDISIISKFKSLYALNLNGTKLKDIRFLDGLESLCHLYLRDTQVSDIGIINQFKSMKSLSLQNTQVSDISAISELLSLSSLNLRNTKVSDISVLKDLKSLHNLNLRGSKVRDINSISGLKSLSYLDLRDLTISAIPQSFLDLELDFKLEKKANGSGIYIYGLQLTDQPIEIFSQDRELIRAYYREHDRVPVNECKVVFLGDAETGKTHSIKRLLKKGEKISELKSQSTPGIEITVKTMKLEDSDIVVNYWDFGGQEIQHSMHRMFLTERTIYVVFLNARQDHLLDEKARYWLDNICSFAQDAPVLLVINKMDQNKHPTFNEDGIRNDYGSRIKKIVKMSALRDEPETFMDELQGSINEIIRELPTVSSKVPRSWKSLMEDIRTMTERYHYLTTNQFKERCSACGVRDFNTIHDDLVDLFQIIGISFCYYKNRTIADYMLLDPKWLVNAIYTIIYNSIIAAHNGVITQDDLYDLLKEDTLNGETITRVIPNMRYESNQVNYILGVIRMFHLSYPMKDGSEFFPMLCDGNEKISVEKAMPKNALHYIFRYTYLPANVMHRLVVEMQRDLDEEYVWYSGAVFRNDYQKQTAYIHTKGNDLHIYVDALDPYYNPNEYLTPIQNIVRAINSDMNLSAEEYVTYREGHTEAEIDAEELKGNLESGIERVYNKKLKRAIDYRDVARRYSDLRPKIKGDLLPKIIKALGLMQNEKACYKTTENSHELEDLRNRSVSSKVLMAEYNCNDQQSGGIGEGGRLTGERDIVFRNKSGQDILIYEGLNLTGFSTKKIDNHLHKLMENYNPQGMPYGVLVSYVDCDRTRFNEITTMYREHITDCAPENYVCVGQPRNIPTIGQYLKCIEMDYECGGQYFTIYHILVGMVEQM